MEQFLVPNLWELLSLLGKLGAYAGGASIAGASLFLVLYSDNRRQTVLPVLNYALAGAILGFQAVALNYLIQIGMINDAGLAGMLDWSMAQLLFDTQLGDVTVIRLISFAFASVVCAYYLLRSKSLTEAPSSSYYRRFFTLNVLCLFGFALSFRLSGHVSVLNQLAGLSIAFHVMAFSFWIGIIYPLYCLSYGEDRASLQLTLKTFGQHAIVLLVSLLVTGLVMLWELFHSLAEFYSSAYGLSILTKLMFVLIILSIAAANKLVFVPKLLLTGGVQKFRQSLTFELAAAAVILVTTAYLSTIVGPMSH